MVEIQPLASEHQAGGVSVILTIQREEIESRSFRRTRCFVRVIVRAYAHGDQSGD
jgi:hypothetical protein